jgi:hypothetical protein
VPLTVDSGSGASGMVYSMPALPWWLLACAVAGSAGTLIVLALKAFRRGIRSQFIALLRERQPHIEVIEEREACLVLRVGPEQGAQANLANLYSAVAGLRPDTLEARRGVYDRHIKALVEAIETHARSLSLNTHGDFIMPRLVPQRFLTSVSDDGDLPRTPLMELGLSVVYVIDAENSVAYITRANAEELGLDATALHTRAITNLQRLTPSTVAQGVLEKQSLVMFKTGDTYDAARLLLIPAQLADGQELAAAIPDRDTLALAPVPRNGDWATLRKLARTPAGEHLLLDRPVRVTRSGISLV